MTTNITENEITNPLEYVLEYFPTGTAEGDRDILDKVFIYAQEFKQIISPPKASPHLLVGTKGSGKTAVLNFSTRLLDGQGIPNIILTPFDIDSTGISQNSSTGDLARSLYERLMDSIITKLSESNSGLFSGDYAKLYHYSVEKGDRPADFFTRGARFISSLAQPIVKIDIAAAFPHLNSSTQREVEAAVKRIVDKKGFYLFIDDTDQVGQPGVAGHLNRVWALLLAVRKLTYDISDLRAVVSLRTEVWNRLQRDDYGQRDQTDHFRRLVVMMDGDREHVGKIVDRRLALAAVAAQAKVDGYQKFFDGSDARAPMSEERRFWRDLILVRTRERPRDAIQLINELAKKSMRENKEKITEDVFQSVVPPFSKSVSEQFGEEVRQEFPQAIEYLRSLANATFSQGGFTMTAEEAREHFKKTLSRYPAIMSGVSLSQESPESVFTIWRFFYQSGVLNARVSDFSMPAGFKHLDPNSDPHLVARTRWNDLQAILWEVNTVYRDYLIEVQRDLNLRTGLPQKSKRRRR